MLERTNLMLQNASDESQRGPLFGQRVVDRVKGLGWLFIITVFVPTAVALIYYCFLASDVYVSESRFVVRSPDAPTTSGFGILLKSAGFTSAGDELYAAEGIIQSRDALRALNRNNAFARAYDNNSVSIFDRFGVFGYRNFESLYKYYLKKVKVDHDTTSSITTLTVRSFDGRTAQRINEELLEMAESAVNRLNERGRSDLIQFASTEVADAKDKSRRAALALSAYRNSHGLVDPERQATVQLQMISKLQDELIAARNQLAGLRAFTPLNPQVEVLEARIAQLQSDINGEMGKVAGGQKSLAAAASEYQRLALEAQFADRQLTAAMSSLEDAQNEARRKQAYVERIVQPGRPDYAVEPMRFRNILATFVLGLVAWGVLGMLLAGVREHRD